MAQVNEVSLSGTVYKNFIEAALKRSDAFGLDVWEKTLLPDTSYKIIFDEIEQADEAFLFKTTGKSKDDCVRFWTDVQEKAKTDFEIYQTKYKSFVQLLSEYEIKHEEGSSISNKIYQIGENTQDLLLMADTIMDWQYPSFPDNLAFYKNGFCWFFTTIHEYNVDLLPDSVEDMLFWESLGVAFISEFDREIDVKSRPYIKYFLE